MKMKNNKAVENICNEITKNWESGEKLVYENKRKICFTLSILFINSCINGGDDEGGFFLF